MIIKNDITWKGSLKNQTFENHKFENLQVLSPKINDCKFYNIEFKHSSLGTRTAYKNCAFVNCKLRGQYTSLGPSRFTNCIFQNCDFQGAMIFMGATFKDSKFSGKMKNNILKTEKRFFKNSYKFNNCNLEEIEFSNITFSGSRLFNSCKLPKKSIRIFNNVNDQLIKHANLEIQKLSGEAHEKISVIFDSQFAHGQDPFMIDMSFLKTFLNNEKTLIEFENIVSNFEIK